MELLMISVFINVITPTEAEAAAQPASNDSEVCDMIYQLIFTRASNFI